MERTITIDLYGEPIETFEYEFDEGTPEVVMYEIIAEYVMSGINIGIE